MKIIKSDEASRAVQVGRKNRKTFRVLEGTGIIEVPIYTEGWWFVPFAEDTSVIPQEALRRVELLQNAGIQIKDMIVAHEAPLALMAPKEDRQVKRQKEELKSGLIAVASVVVMALGALVLAVPMLLASMVLVDPCLIVVLSSDDPETDGQWLEVCAWDESFH